jgi:hypothetical protein
LHGHREALVSASDRAACRDLGQHDWAQRYYQIAMQAAHAAGDHALAGHLVVRMTGHHIELAQPAEVLTYLNAASQSGRRGVFTHGELSNQHAIAAWANAQNGLAHLTDHDLSQALHTTSRAIHLANECASRRVRKRLGELASQLTPHGQNPETADALEQIRTLLSKKQ